MTPEEYYKNVFSGNYAIIKGLKHQKLFSLNSCLQLMELYHNAEIERILKPKK